MKKSVAVLLSIGCLFVLLSLISFVATSKRKESNYNSAPLAPQDADSKQQDSEQKLEEKCLRTISYQYVSPNEDAAVSELLKDVETTSTEEDRIDFMDSEGSSLTFQGENFCELSFFTTKGILYQYALSKEGSGSFGSAYIEYEDFHANEAVACAFESREQVLEKINSLVQELTGHLPSENYYLGGFTQEYLAQCFEANKQSAKSQAENNKKAAEVYKHIFQDEMATNSLEDCYVYIGSFEINGIPIDTDYLTWKELGNDQVRMYPSPSIFCIISNQGFLCMEIDGCFDEIESEGCQEANLMDAKMAKEKLLEQLAKNQNASFGVPCLQYITRYDEQLNPEFLLCWSISGKDESSLTKHYYVDAETGVMVS